MLAINGEVLHVRQGDMMDDSVSKDVVRISVGPVISCAEFRDKARASVDGMDQSSAPPGKQPDKKQAVADAIMEELEKMHIKGEENRKRFLK